MTRANGWYQASEFARLAGVTVRTLHHYDRLGLLKPARRTSGGYRLYSERDVARLQQVVTLKFIGFSLKQIRDLLNKNPFNLGAALRLQREIIEEKRRRLDLAIRAIRQAERAIASSKTPDWEAFAKIIEVINMQSHSDWMKKYYTEEQLKELAARGTEQVMQKAQQDLADLIKDVEAAIGIDPASERAQTLAARWSALIEAFTGGNSDIAAGLNKFYADQSNWPAGFKKPYSQEVEEFIRSAVAVRKV